MNMTDSGGGSVKVTLVKHWEYQINCFKTLEFNITNDHLWKLRAAPLCQRDDEVTTKVSASLYLKVNSVKVCALDYQLPAEKT